MNLWNRVGIISLIIGTILLTGLIPSGLAAPQPESAKIVTESSMNMMPVEAYRSDMEIVMMGPNGEEIVVSPTPNEVLPPPVLNIGPGADCNSNGVDDATEIGLWDNHFAAAASSLGASQVNGNTGYANSNLVDDISLSTNGSAIAGPNVITSIRFRNAESLTRNRDALANTSTAGIYAPVFNWNGQVRVQVYTASNTNGSGPPSAGAPTIFDSTVSTVYRVNTGVLNVTGGTYDTLLWSYTVTGLNIVLPAGRFFVSARPVGLASNSTSTTGGQARALQSTAIVGLGAYHRTGNPPGAGGAWSQFAANDLDFQVDFGRDANSNSTPDSCEDCDTNGTPDGQEAWVDCNTNNLSDLCEIMANTNNAYDCNTNGSMDLCEGDCNTNNKADACDLAKGTGDCDANGTLDRCEMGGTSFVVYDQSADWVARTGGICDSRTPRFGADDFTLAVPTDITGVSIGGFFSGTAGNGFTDLFRVKVWTNSGTLPGTVIYTEDIPTSRMSRTTAQLNFVYTLKLAAPLHLAPGTYWLEVTYTGPATGSWVWGLATTPAKGTSVALAAAGSNVTLSTVGPPEVWGGTYSTFGAPIFRFAFKLYTGTGDCNTNGTLDACDVDANSNGTVDVCEDCNNNGTPDPVEPGNGDCNSNGLGDLCDISGNPALDCDTNGTIDSCEIAGQDCNTNNTLDVCDINNGLVDCDTNEAPDICQSDCNTNGHYDVCDVAEGTTGDCNTNNIPDACDAGPQNLVHNHYLGTQSGTGYFADENRPQVVADEFVLTSGTTVNRVVVRGFFNGTAPAANLDEYTVKVWSNDANSNKPATVLFTQVVPNTRVTRLPQGGNAFDMSLSLTPELILPAGTFWLEVYYSGTGTASGTGTPQWLWYVSNPLNGFQIHFSLAIPEVAWAQVGDATRTLMFQLYNALSVDCDTNGTPDECELNGATDSNSNGSLDVCEDCNTNGTADPTEPGYADCNTNLTPDFCDSLADCNSDGTLDICQYGDCNTNNTLDECDIDNGATDCDSNGTPDSCQPDCNSNGKADTCDITGPTSEDCNTNGVPDECDLASPQPVVDHFTGTDAANGYFADAARPQAVADDFTLSNAAYVDRVVARGYFTGTAPAANLDQFTVNIWSNSGANLPLGPTPLHSQTVTSANVQRVLVSGAVNDFVMDLPTPIALPAGTYWLQVTYSGTGTVSGTGTPQWVWRLRTPLDGFRIAFTQTPPFTTFLDSGDTTRSLYFRLYNTSSTDCDNDGTLDACQSYPDCDTNGTPDACDLLTHDCNNNGTVDACETGGDCNTNQTPDSCDLAGQDCNSDGTIDNCETGFADCNTNGLADTCETAANDCNSDGTIDACNLGDDCNTNGTHDECDLSVTGAMTMSSADTPLLIPDNDPLGVVSDITVTGSGTVTDVNVGLSIQHTFDSDLYMVLFNDVSTNISFLAIFRGGSDDNFTGTVFDDEAGTPIGGGAAPFTGTFRPESLLSAFDGQPKAALWSLYAEDTFTGDTGTLLTWTLQLSLSVNHDANTNGTPDECDPQCATCTGDINGDGNVDGQDIGGWVRCVVFNMPQGGDICACSAGMTTAQFINKLLTDANPACP